MDPLTAMQRDMTRRQLLQGGMAGLGSAALAQLLPGSVLAKGGAMGGTHHPAKAKNVIYLFQNVTLVLSAFSKAFGKFLVFAFHTLEED